jgi:hypothetical protein
MEGVANVHNEVLAATLVVAALIVLQRRSTMALPCIMLASLVKYFTFQLLPLFLLVMVARRWKRRAILTSALAAVAVAIVAVAPFWDGGAMIDGIRRVNDAYTGSVHISISSLEWQYRLQGIPVAEWETVPTHAPLFMGLFALLSIPVFWRVWKGGSPARASNQLYLLFLLFLTLLYPWYLIPVVAVVGLTRTRLDLAYVAVATTLGLLYYPFYVWAHFSSDLPVFRVHLFLSLFVTLPIVVYLALQVVGALHGHRVDLSATSEQSGGSIAGVPAMSS